MFGVTVEGGYNWDLKKEVKMARACIDSETACKLSGSLFSGAWLKTLHKACLRLQERTFIFFLFKLLKKHPPGRSVGVDTLDFLTLFFLIVGKLWRYPSLTIL